jgi:hypothetical protein
MFSKDFSINHEYWDFYHTNSIHSTAKTYKRRSYIRTSIRTLRKGEVHAFFTTTGAAESQSTSRSEGKRERSTKSEVLQKKDSIFTMSHTKNHGDKTKIEIIAPRIDLYL